MNVKAKFLALFVFAVIVFGFSRYIPWEKNPETKPPLYSALDDDKYKLEKTKHEDRSAALDVRSKHTNELDIAQGKQQSQVRVQNLKTMGYTTKGIPRNTQISSNRHDHEMDQSMFDEHEAVTERIYQLLESDSIGEVIQEARRLMTHTNRLVRWTTAETLWWIGAPALSAMAFMMDDPDQEIKEWIIDAFFAELEHLENEKHIAEILSLAVKSPDPAVRLQSLEIFSGISSSVAFVPMSHLLEDSDPEVREQARFNLFFIADEDFASTQDAIAWHDQHSDELEEVQDSEPSLPEIILPRGRLR